MTTDNQGNEGQGADEVAAAAAAAAKASGENGDQKADDGNSAIYKPEGIADHYLGTTDHETIDKLNEAVTGFRKQQSAKGVPAKPEDYVLDLADDIKAKVLQPDDKGVDPVLAGFQKIFHEQGIPQAAFTAIAGKVYEMVAELNANNPQAAGGEAITLDFEFKEMGGLEKAKPAIDGVNAWMNGLKNTGKLSAEAMAELTVMAGYSEGMKALLELRAAAGEKPIPVTLTPGGGAGSGKVTEKEINDRVADPRYRKGSKDYDESFYKETERLFKEFYGSDSSAA